MLDPKADREGLGFYVNVFLDQHLKGIPRAMPDSQDDVATVQGFAAGQGHAGDLAWVLGRGVCAGRGLTL